MCLARPFADSPGHENRRRDERSVVGGLAGDRSRSRPVQYLCESSSTHLVNENEKAAAAASPSVGRT